MGKFLKSGIFLVIMLFTVSMAGCGTNTSAPKESKNVETASAEPANQTVKVKHSENQEKKPVEEKVKKEVDTSKNESNQTSDKKPVVVKKEPASTPKEQNNPPKQESSSSSTVVKKPAAATTKAKTESDKRTEKGKTSTTETAVKTTAPTTKPAAQKPISTVTMSIIGPKDHGTILSSSKVNINKGDTVLKVLLQAQKKGINVDYRGSGATAYIEGIDNVYEFDYGPKSGWTCKKNGVTITRSAGVITVNAGDRIDWVYTDDYSEKK